MLSQEPERRQVDDWKIAERNAAEWMRYWGFTDARVTPAGADGGIDIRSSKALGQVKFQGALVGRAELQRLVGARMRGEHRLFFFTASGYSAPAVTYGDAMDIALFQYDPWGRMKAVNKTAAAALASAQLDRATKHLSAGLAKINFSFEPKKGLPLGCGLFLVIGSVLGLVHGTQSTVWNCFLIIVGLVLIRGYFVARSRGSRSHAAKTLPRSDTPPGGEPEAS